VFYGVLSALLDAYLVTYGVLSALLYAYLVFYFVLNALQYAHLVFYGVLSALLSVFRSAYYSICRVLRCCERTPANQAASQPTN
jgi:hypothetical protein